MSYSVPPKFSRASSMSTIDMRSTSGSNVGANGSISTRPRRTSTESDLSTGGSRKRFTPTDVQLMMLENMYKHNPHPSRQERETLSKAGTMNLKHVTTWFQNKRQKSAARNHTQVQAQTREQRKALLNATNSSRVGKRASRSPPSQTRVKSVSPRPADPDCLQLYPVSMSAPVAPVATPAPPRPSLDRVASRSELPSFIPPPSSPLSQSSLVLSPPSSQESMSSVIPFSPQTPRRGVPRPIYECMPASPPTPLFSPAATSRDRECFEFGIGIGSFGKRKVTLEWACARRRIAEKEGYVSSIVSDDEDMAPPPFRKRTLERSVTWAAGQKEDDDIMRAALALCGLGRGRGTVSR